MNDFFLFQEMRYLFSHMENVIFEEIKNFRAGFFLLLLCFVKENYVQFTFSNCFLETLFRQNITNILKFKLMMYTNSPITYERAFFTIYLMRRIFILNWYFTWVKNKSHFILVNYSTSSSVAKWLATDKIQTPAETETLRTRVSLWLCPVHAECSTYLTPLKTE